MHVQVGFAYFVPQALIFRWKCAPHLPACDQSGKLASIRAFVGRSGCTSGSVVVISARTASKVS